MQSRREFLRTASAFALSASLPLDRIEPELILYNGNIITINDLSGTALKQVSPNLARVVGRTTTISLPRS